MKHGDINDTAREQGIDGVRARHDRARKFNGGSPPPAHRAPHLSFDCIADIEPRPIEWLWAGRIARRKVTLIAGDPGMAKSQIALDVAARLSRADAWPDGGRAPKGSTIILSAEDAAADVLRPRLDAAGAELDHLHVLRAVIDEHGQRRTFSLQADLEALGEKICELGDVALVIIDPITSYMGSKIDSYRNTDVRAVLEPMAEFAERFNVAVLAVSHPPKHAPTKAINAITGSLAFVAAARLVFLAIEEADAERRLLLAVKNNLGAPAPGIAYRSAQSIVAENIIAPHIVWDSKPVTITADEALAASANNDADKITEAREFLVEELADGGKAAADIQQKAAELGITGATLRRARKKLGVVARKDGFQGGWIWELPPR